MYYKQNEDNKIYRYAEVLILLRCFLSFYFRTKHFVNQKRASPIDETLFILKTTNITSITEVSGHITNI